MTEKHESEEVQSVAAIKSLVVTAIKWLNTEFPVPSEGAEYQTVQEILKDLRTSCIALDNLSKIVETKPELS